MSQKIEVELPLKDLGYPGSSGDWSLLLDTEDEKRKDEDRLYDKVERQYEMIGYLNKGVILRDNFTIDLNEESGSSFIKVNPHLKRLDFEANNVKFKILKNSENELSRIEFNCICTSINNAYALFNAVTIPLIDHISYIGNIPITIEKIVGHDKKNNILFSNYDVPYSHYLLDENNNIGFVNEYMRPIYALYREAKNSYSKFYRFLCYYKILEGIYKIIRPETYKKAQKLDMKLVLDREIVPNDKFITGKHKRYIGKPIKEIFDGYFKNEFRHSIAHFTARDSTPFIISDFSTHIQVTSTITLIELCCRIVIDNQVVLLNKINGR